MKPLEYCGEQVRIPCVIYRGGTSKAVFMKRNDLPGEGEQRDVLLLSIFGSPDPRQIDGIGGGDTLTSKFALIGPPTRKDADVDYTFAQVSPDRPIVDWKGNCGNISSAVGPYAIDEGFVDAVEPSTTIRIHQVNMNCVITAKVPVKGHKPAINGNFSIDGVPGTGAKIELDFRDFAGSTSGKLLPTGKVVDELEIEGLGKIDASIIDAANPLVFFRARDLGLTGLETPNQIDSNKKLLDTIEKIRGTVAELIGLVDDWREASEKSLYIPFIAFVREPTEYTSWTTGKVVKPEQIDLVSRLLFMGWTHKTYPITGTVATGIAAKIEGTIVNEMLPKNSINKENVNIGHPAGVVSIEAEVLKKGKSYEIKKANVGRTARRIMEGYVYVRNIIFK
jgi:2-methylaconitate cis-trans-isomerase PrpF